MGTVLLVDDSPADRALFRSILGRAGHSVVDVPSGQEVVREIEAHCPHVVVLDVNLPDLPGSDVCRTIRAHPRHGSLPVLLLTSQQAEADVLAGLDAGADDYVGKDDPHAVIVARVERLIRYRMMSHAAALNEQLAQVGRLVAGVVHEIRGPLSVIRGHAELLQFEQQAAGTDPTWTEPILRNVELLQSRLDYLMGSIRSEIPRRHRCMVKEILREAVNLYTKGVDPFREGVRIETRGDGGDLCIDADGGQLIQALILLFGHCHRVSQTPSQKAEIVVGCLSEDGLLTIRIEDNGPPLSEPQSGRFFEPFLALRTGDVGFGPYLASAIISDHGGRIVAENLGERGVCLTIRIPQPAPPQPSRE